MTDYEIIEQAKQNAQVDLKLFLDMAPDDLDFTARVRYAIRRLRKYIEVYEKHCFGVFK